MAQVDFFKTKKGQSIKNKNNMYQINEGEAKFLPELQELLLEISKDKEE